MRDEEWERDFGAIYALTAGVKGFLTEREARCLVLLGSVRTTDGIVLEIGSFKGRSTILLAKAAHIAGDVQIVAVDPLTSPSETDPDLGGKANGWSDFQANLKSAGVEHAVEFHMETSQVLATKWDPARKIRLLWIDAGHTYLEAKADFDLFSPFLANGAVVAIHDVLHSHGGPARVFAEDVLLSPHFGPFGFCGSIGWSQYFESSDRASPYRRRKLRLYSRLSTIVSFTAFGDCPRGLNYLRYKLARSRIPHGEMQPSEFRRQVASFH